MIIASVGVVVMYKLHYFVERRYKVDDAVGAVAVHGYAGFFGVVVAGFMLWGYPSSPNPEFATINPLGQFIGAIIMFFVLGFIPGWVAAKILNGMGILRIPREIELAGLDIGAMHDREQDEQGIIDAEKEEIARM